MVPGFIKISLITILTLIPPLRLAYFLFTNGENCANNDDIYYLEQFVRMTSSSYNWANYFADTFIFGHSTAFNQLVFNLFVQIGHLNQNLGAAIGLVLIAGRLVLIFDLTFSPTNNKRWYYLPLLSAIIFAPTCASILTHGSFAITWQLALTLGAAALWAIFKKADTAAILIASICIVLGSWTIATTLVTIPIVWICAWSRKLLNKCNLIILGISTALAIFPDVLYLEHGVGIFGPIKETLKPLDLSMFLSSLGRNFVPGTAWYMGYNSAAVGFSVLGLVLLFAICALANVSRQTRLQKAIYPAFAIAAFAVGNLMLTTIVRPLIAPWYGQISIWFWLGLVGMAASLLEFSGDDQKLSSKAKILGITTLICLTNFAIFSPSIKDKEFFLDNRSPAYLSALRNYETPPQPGLLPPYKFPDFTIQRLARILERYHLPPFDKEDTVLLQGDCAIPGIVQFQNDGTKDCHLFFRDDKDAASAVTDYKRLNLVLDGAMTVAWHVTIPADAKFAEFAVGLRRGTAGSKLIDENSNVVTINVGTNQPLVYKLHPKVETDVKVDLIAYRGKVVDIIFSHKGDSLTPAVFEVPKVEIRREFK